MSNYTHPVLARASAKTSGILSRRVSSPSRLLAASSKTFLFDLIANTHLSSDCTESDVDAFSLEAKNQTCTIHPADLAFAKAARKAIIRQFETAATRGIKVKASLQFRMVHPSGIMRLVNQVVSPADPTSAAKHHVQILETDLTNIATNPVKSVRIYNATDDSEAAVLTLDGFEANTDACPFSDRQLQILRLLAEGRTTAQVSKSLFISADTVRTHRQHILQRSSHENMTSTVVECVRKGWI